MKIHQHSVEVKEYYYQEASSQDQFLLDKALEIAAKAHAPYSNFYVGAAILLDNREVVTGNNQENVSYPAGICAERTAMFWAMANYPDAKPLRIAITYIYHEEDKQPLAPCGVCRQALLEYELKKNCDITLLLWDGVKPNGKIYELESFKASLPLAFNLPSLKR